MKETRIHGQCKCGRKVIKILNSEVPTCRVDGIRYVYSSEPRSEWCIFRCRDCSSVINDSFMSAEVKP